MRMSKQPEPHPRHVARSLLITAVLHVKLLSRETVRLGLQMLSKDIGTLNQLKMIGHNRDKSGTMLIKMLSREKLVAH